MKNYKQAYQDNYKKIFPKINVREVLKSYRINFTQYYGNKGEEFLFCCPFPEHDDYTPSFSLNKKTGVWHCFVCGGGDFFKFIKIIENFSSTKQAIEFLQQKLGISDDFNIDFDYLDKSFKDFGKVEEAETATQKIEFKAVKLPECEPAENYLEIVKKRVDLNTIKEWGLKYCVNPKSTYEQKYKDRLIVPIYYENKLVTFAARDMSDKTEKWNKIKKQIKEGKYSKEECEELTAKYQYKKILYPFAAPISYIFFNWHNAIKNPEYVILVEGVFDAMKLHEYGFNVVSILSTHLNDYRINLLIKHFKIIYIAFDNDDKVNSFGKRVNPGQEAAKKVIDEKLSDIEVYNILLPPGKDPDECSKQEFERFFGQAKYSF